MLSVTAKEPNYKWTKEELFGAASLWLVENNITEEKDNKLK